jgi:hypothetical protein
MNFNIWTSTTPPPPIVTLSSPIINPIQPIALLQELTSYYKTIITNTCTWFTFFCTLNMGALSGGIFAYQQYKAAFLPWMTMMDIFFLMFALLGLIIIILIKYYSKKFEQAIQQLYKVKSIGSINAEDFIICTLKIHNGFQFEFDLWNNTTTLMIFVYSGYIIVWYMLYMFSYQTSHNLVSNYPLIRLLFSNLILLGK